MKGLVLSSDSRGAVRVWVSGHDDRVTEYTQRVRALGFSVRDFESGERARSESDEIRWSDVVLLLADQSSLESSQAFLAGLVKGAGKPVLFLGPSSVDAPVLAASEKTLVEPVDDDALRFQLEALGHKRAARRAKNAAAPIKDVLQAPRVSQQLESDWFDHGRWHFDSHLEAEVFGVLGNMPGVKTVLPESKVLLPARSSDAMVADFLVWMEAVMPFSPTPVEVKGEPRARDYDRMFEYLSASGSRLGVVISDSAQRIETPRFDDFGYCVVTFSLRELRNNPGQFTDELRRARNALVHGVKRG